MKKLVEEIEGRGRYSTESDCMVEEINDEKVSRPRVVRKRSEGEVLEYFGVKGCSCSVMFQRFYLVFCLYNLRIRSLFFAVR
jgi:hypothetical protein